MMELKLSEYAGQEKDVTLHRRNDGSKYITFHASQHCGHPSLDLHKLKRLVVLLEQLGET